MTELPPEARELLRRAREADAPSERDREHMLSALHATLGLGPVAPLFPDPTTGVVASKGAASSVVSTTGGTAASTVAQAGTTTGAIAVKGAATKGLVSLLGMKATKLVIASVVLGGAATVAVVPRLEPKPSGPAQTAHHERAAPVASVPERAREQTEQVALQGASERASLAHPPQPGRSADGTPAVAGGTPEQRAEAPVVGPLQGLAAARAQTPSAGPVASARARAPVSLRRERARFSGAAASNKSVLRPSAGAPASPSVEASAPKPLASESVTSDTGASGRESELIRRALTSLRDHQPTSALAVLDEHASRFPSGAFATERAGLRVLALCEAGRTEEGLRARAEFLREAGKAPIAARVRHACEIE